MPLFKKPEENFTSFLGTFTNPNTNKPFDVYFRAKPFDPHEGFCDAIIVKWSNYKNDLFMSPSDKFPLSVWDPFDDRFWALRVGYLICKDMGLLK